MTRPGAAANVSAYGGSRAEGGSRVLIATVGRDTALQVLESKSNLIAEHLHLTGRQIGVAVTHRLSVWCCAGAQLPRMAGQ
jgi:hypothetical protein